MEEGKIYKGFTIKDNIEILLRLIKLEDYETYTHCLRTGRITKEILEEENIKISKEEKEEIIDGALIHDLGKCLIPCKLQNLPFRLNANEKEIIKIHPVIGEEFINGTRISELTKKIVLLHHTPYKELKEIGLTETEMMGIYIVSYADKIDALSSKRPYRHPISNEEIIKKLREIQSKEEKERFAKIIKKAESGIITNRWMNN